MIGPRIWEHVTTASPTTTLASAPRCSPSGSTTTTGTAPMQAT